MKNLSAESKRLKQIRQAKSSTELAYLAGYLDGEGCIRLDNTKTHSLHLAIVSGDRTVLERFVTAFGGKLIPVKKRQSHHRDLWYWGACNAEAQAILLQLVPFLQSKLTQTVLAILPNYRNANIGRGRKMPDSEARMRIMVCEALRVSKSMLQGQIQD